MWWSYTCATETDYVNQYCRSMEIPESVWQTNTFYQPKYQIETNFKAHFSKSTKSLVFWCRPRLPFPNIRCKSYIMEWCLIPSWKLWTSHIGYVFEWKFNLNKIPFSQYLWPEFDLIPFFSLSTQLRLTYGYWNHYYGDDVPPLLY